MTFIEQSKKYGSQLGLETMTELLSRMNNPEKKLKFIHVAGTNGKGSTSAYIASIMQNAGYRTGLFTSPYFSHFREMMRVNGQVINDEMISEITPMIESASKDMVNATLPHPTEFEVFTAMAFEYFYQMNCEIVVLEVGLGGRLDATNVIPAPLLAVITPLALDHMAFLGDTLTKIAIEKAGIIKKGCQLVLHPQALESRTVIEQKCADLGVSLIEAPITAVHDIKASDDNQSFVLKGETYEIESIAPYQIDNAVVAITAVKALDTATNNGFHITEISIKKGLKEMHWAGRMEIVQKRPLTIIDGAHNVQGIEALIDTLETRFPDYKIVGVIGVLMDKDVTGMLSPILPKLNEVIVTTPESPRALPAKALAQKLIAEYGISCLGVFDQIEGAVAFVNSIDFRAKSTIENKNLCENEKKALILYFGSLYMIGKVRALYRDHNYDK